MKKSRLKKHGALQVVEEFLFLVPHTEKRCRISAILKNWDA